MGLNFVNTPAFGSRNLAPPYRREHHLTPFIWATTAQAIEACLPFVFLQPIIASSTPGAVYQSAFSQRRLAAEVAGHDVHFRFVLGRYVPSDTKIVIQNAVPHQRSAHSDHPNGEDWNLPGNFPLRRLLRHVVVRRRHLPRLPQSLAHSREVFQAAGDQASRLWVARSPDEQCGPCALEQGVVSALGGCGFGLIDRRAYVTGEISHRNSVSLKTEGSLRTTVPLFHTMTSWGERVPFSVNL